MKCPSCQAEVQPTGIVCPKCGAGLSGGPEPQEQAETVAEPRRGPQSGRAVPATRAQADTVAVPQPEPQPGGAARDAPGRAVFLDFNERPANIILVMDEAKRRQGEFVTSFWQRALILVLLLPAGVSLLLLDRLLGYDSWTFSLVAYVLWGAALVGSLVLRRQTASSQDYRLDPQGGRLGQISTAIVWLVIAVSLFVAGVLLCNFLAENPLRVAGLVLGLAAAFALISLWRRGPRGEVFGGRFDGARIVFETLKDDVAPRRTLLGWLDLSGAQQPGKVVRERISGSKMPIKYYRDEWLHMKMPLCDGNLLRVSVVERVKARQGRWKRGSSGKQKWKSGGTPLERHEVRVAVALDPAAFQILPVQDGGVGEFLVHVAQRDRGRLELRATKGTPIDGRDILRLLRFAYDHVKPCVTPAVAEGQ